MSNPLRLFRKYQAALLVAFGIVLMFAFVIGPVLSDYLQTRAGRGRGASGVVVSWRGGELREADVARLRSVQLLITRFLQQLVSRVRVVQDDVKVERKGQTVRLIQGRTYPLLGRSSGDNGMVFQIAVEGEVVTVAAQKEGESRPRVEPIRPRPGVQMVTQSRGEEDLVRRMLLAEEAKERGMVVSEGAVLDYLDSLSDVTADARPDYVGLLKSSTNGRVSWDQFLEHMSMELAAQRMLIMSYSGLMATSPNLLYQCYNKLNRRVNAELLAVNVRDFLDEVPEPNDQEIRALYEEGKDRFPNPDSPEPGFKQRQKIKFQYVAGTFDDFLQREMDRVKPTITDEEIEQYYAENKENYRITELPEESSAPPGKEPPTKATKKKAADQESAEGETGDEAAEAPRGPGETTEAGDAEPDEPERPDAEPDQATPEAKPVKKTPAEDESPQEGPEANKKANAPEPPPKKAVEPTPPKPARPDADNDPSVQERSDDEATDDSATDDPATDDPATDDPATDDPANDDSANDDSGNDDSGNDDSATDEQAAEGQARVTWVSYQQPAEANADSPPEETVASEPSAEGPEEGAEEPSPEAPPVADPVKEAAEAVPATEGAEEEPPASAKQPASAGQAAEPKATAAEDAEAKKEAAEDAEAKKEAAEEPDRYKPLDEELRAEIREEMARRRAREPAQEQLEAAIDGVRAKLQKFSRDLALSEELDDRKAPAPLDIEAIAEENKLRFLETPRWDRLDVRLIQESEPEESDPRFHELARATETVWSRMGQNQRSLLDVAFGAELEKYMPREFVDGVVMPSGYPIPPQKMFLYWRVAVDPERTPALREVRGRVIHEWKMKQALPLAQAHAQEMAERANEAGQPLVEVFADGAETVIRTTPFSWMTRGSMPGRTGGRPMLSSINGTANNQPVSISGADNDFMRSVFRLEVDEVGTATNASQTFVYVVRVGSEERSDEERREAFFETGPTQDINSLVQEQQSRIAMDWLEELEQKYELQWAREPETDWNSRGRRA